MTTRTLTRVLTLLQEECKNWNAPIVTLVAERSKDPFQVLLSTMLSLRTKDEVTTRASRSLFEKADTPEKILRLTNQEIQKLIYPVGFYKTKAKHLLEVSRILLQSYQGRVPDTMDELLQLPGVGRKTANLVLTLGFGKPGVCVDTHVHRISNRLGYVRTRTPNETEIALRSKLPKKWWIPYNDILVTFGQTLCKPISPWCSRCRVEQYCEKVSVGRSR